MILWVYLLFDVRGAAFSVATLDSLEGQERRVCLSNPVMGSYT